MGFAGATTVSAWLLINYAETDLSRVMFVIATGWGLRGLWLVYVSGREYGHW